MGTCGEKWPGPDHTGIVTTSEIFITSKVISHFYYLPLTGGKLRCRSRWELVAEQELAVRRQPTAQLQEAGMSLISKGEEVASEGWSNTHPSILCTNTRLRAKGFPYLSQPGVPALGEHACWGFRLRTATPKVPSHVPSVSPALVVFDLCHLLTETLRHREGKKLA